MKPRLRKVNGLWSCSGLHSVGWGLTPLQAWMMWNWQTVPWPPVAPVLPAKVPFWPPRDVGPTWPWFDDGTGRQPPMCPITVSRVQ